jgi:hypothetical protein
MAISLALEWYQIGYGEVVEDNRNVAARYYLTFVDKNSACGRTGGQGASPGNERLPRLTPEVLSVAVT